MVPPMKNLQSFAFLSSMSSLKFQFIFFANLALKPFKYFVGQFLLGFCFSESCHFQSTRNTIAYIPDIFMQ